LNRSLREWRELWDFQNTATSRILRPGISFQFPFMNFCRFFYVVAGVGTLLLACVAEVFAHAPFDASARVIVHEDSAEVMVTVGSALGDSYVRLAQINPARLVQGHSFALNPDMATNFFSATADEKKLAPRSADVVTDGLEFQFHFDCALGPAKTLRLATYFTPALKPPQAAPLVVTDENGNILGSAILSPDKSTAEFLLSERLFPTNSVTSVASVVATNHRHKNRQRPLLK